ncbi:MAG: glycosyltransferase family 2 protein [Ekhidna sp.]
MSATAVVILNYNGATFLKQFLPAVLCYSGDAKIVVADNASTDNSVQLLENDFPEITLLKLSENYGYAGGYNEALKQIQSDYYVLLNSDIEVTHDWLTPLITFLDDNPTYAACQPKIKDFQHRNLFEYAGAAGGYLDALGYPYCRGRIFETLEIDSGQYNDPADIFWSSGACMIIRASAFHEVGGFDSDFFAHMEEIDLCWRLHSHNYKIRVIPSSTVYHVGGGTLHKASPFKTYLNFRNGLYLLLKNLPATLLIFRLPFRIALDWLACVRFLLKGNFKHAVAVVKAHLKVILTLFKTLSKRDQTSSSPDKRIMVLLYFARGKRKFSEL